MAENTQDPLIAAAVQHISRERQLSEATSSQIHTEIMNKVRTFSYPEDALETAIDILRYVARDEGTMRVAEEKLNTIIKQLDRLADTAF